MSLSGELRFPFCYLCQHLVRHTKFLIVVDVLAACLLN